MWFTALFKRETSDAARRERMEEVERQLSQSLRTIATAFTSLANFIEQRRLQRAGYEKQERFLERTEPRAGVSDAPGAVEKK